MAENKSQELGQIERSNIQKFCTFYVADTLFGIDVAFVQEVTNSLAMTKVPLAPSYVYGLINLRGQIASAVGLRDLFNVSKINQKLDYMNVVCKSDGLLLSLLVDQIGDVLEVDQRLFESTPETLSESIRKFMVGVYKIQGSLLSVLNIQKIVETLQK